MASTALSRSYSTRTNPPAPIPSPVSTNTYPALQSPSLGLPTDPVLRKLTPPTSRVQGLWVWPKAIRSPSLAPAAFAIFVQKESGLSSVQYRVLRVGVGRLLWPPLGLRSILKGNSPRYLLVWGTTCALVHS